MDRDDALRLVDDFVGAYNDGDLSRLDRCVAAGYRHPNPAAAQGRDGMKQAVARWCSAVDGLRLPVEDVIVEGDKIVVRMTFSGRRVGAILDIPPSGREFSIGLVDIFVVEDGLLAGHWDEMDRLGLYRQLGAPVPATT
ncbi:ester cyclase [Micromonospora sp. KC207]|uniref:ester cyclase n=1 Tax=Micromonospora sp. KC207 TaxID=2530377 RepID=UPI0010511D70|nr:ester cyclase [Micromonospora sp. KC207]TDC63684.1 ester cyclase [Micromonospora sp. KC207]